MAGDAGLYRRYTSTTVLPEGTDVGALLAWSHGYFRAHVAPWLPADRGAAIGEVGCGWGRYLTALATMGYTRCEGVDVSEEQVAYARDTMHCATVTCGDAVTWLESRRDRFDCILALDVLEHLENDALVALANAAREALRPAGRLIVHVPNALAQLFRAAGLVPRAFREATAHGRGPAARIRRVLWKAALRPLVGGFMLAANGDAMGGIYTANLIAVAERSAGG
jgi:2-polyprenyl-3-methyl-5-hydroxy-6-metoxy-1,4-benzoquinol methylase